MALDSNIRTALVLAPHPDDGEFGCGGTLRRLSDEGAEVWYAAFSPCTASLPDGSKADRLFMELERAASHLGIPADHIRTFDFDVRYFPRDRQAILETLVRLRKDIKPDLVLLPNSRDVHQDHHTMYEEGLRAFKHCRLLGYEFPWNSLEFRSDFHVKLEEAHVMAKVKAIEAYESQGFRGYSDMEFLKGLARVRGVQVGCEYAEAFEAIRWMV